MIWTYVVGVIIQLRAWPPLALIAAMWQKTKKCCKYSYCDNLRHFSFLLPLVCHGSY